MRPEGDDIWLIHYGGVLEIMLNKQYGRYGTAEVVRPIWYGRYGVMCGLVYAVYSYINSGGRDSHALD